MVREAEWRTAPGGAAGWDAAGDFAAVALGLDQLLDRLEAGFELLAGGDRGAAPRHRSLAATVEWSYHLLDEHERAVFRKLAVFPGPFTLDTATAVASAAAGPVVLHLVDCSAADPAAHRAGRPSQVPDLETLRSAVTTRRRG